MIVIRYSIDLFETWWKCRDWMAPREAQTHGLAEVCFRAGFDKALELLAEQRVAENTDAIASLVAVRAALKKANEGG